MSDLVSVADLVTAAVLADDIEWSDVAFKLKEAPKSDAARMVVACCTSGILKSGLRAPEDVERAISRVAEVAGDLMRLPRPCKTILEHALRPADFHWTTEQRQQFDVIGPTIFQRLSAAAKTKDRATLKELANEIKAQFPFLEPGFVNAESDDDPATAREIFSAYSELYRSWFDLSDWNGARVPKSAAYYLIDSVAAAPSKKVRQDVVYPILRELGASLKD